MPSDIVAENTHQTKGVLCRGAVTRAGGVCFSAAAAATMQLTIAT